MECRLISLNDSPELHRMTLGGREFVFTGCNRAKGRFTVTANQAARRKAKLVLAGHPNLGTVVQTMRLVAPKLKTIICTHGIDVWEPLTVLRRRALRHANLVLTPSRDTADHVATEQGVSRGRIRVLPWALDPQFEALISPGSHPIPPGDFPSGRVILSVGRWVAAERYKGMDTLITALPRLLTRWPELQLVFAGTGDDRAWLEELADQNGVDGVYGRLISGLEKYLQKSTTRSSIGFAAMFDKSRKIILSLLPGESSRTAPTATRKMEKAPTAREKARPAGVGRIIRRMRAAV